MGNGKAPAIGEGQLMGLGCSLSDFSVWLVHEAFDEVSCVIQIKAKPRSKWVALAPG
jgi:hypothetical protein